MMTEEELRLGAAEALLPVSWYGPRWSWSLDSAIAPMVTEAIAKGELSSGETSSLWEAAVLFVMGRRPLRPCCNGRSVSPRARS